MLCLPALIYLVLGIIGIIYYFNKYSIGTILIKTFFILLWTLLLNYICSCGYEVISWILVLLPFILMALFVFILFDHMKEASSNEKYSNIRYM